MTSDSPENSEPRHPDHDELLLQLQQGRFSFIDLGCGSGESIAHCEKQFGLGAGIGFDIDPKKIRAAIENKFPAILADVTKENFEGNLVRFCTMMDFLEHLPSEDFAKEILGHLKNIASDFLFIRHPSFEDIDYLAEMGFKLDWTHWSGHTNMMRIEDFHRVFAELGITDYCILPRKQILSSSHPAIVPLNARINAIRYDSTIHDPKEQVYFGKPVWTQFDIYVKLRDSFPITEWEKVLSTSHDEYLCTEALSKLERETHKRRNIEKNLVTELKKRRDLQAEAADLAAQRRELKEDLEQTAGERREAKADAERLAGELGAKKQALASLTVEKKPLEDKAQASSNLSHTLPYRLTRKLKNLLSL